MRVLVTGGAGYIGSHTVLRLLESGHEVVVVDNLYNASRESIKRVEKLTQKAIDFIEGDICDTALLNRAFSEYKPEAVIHFAGLKAVGESVEKPTDYYQINVAGSLNLVQVMFAHDCQHIIFSSSATVYGVPEFLPYTESHPVSPTSPYGWTKLMVEQILRDTVVANERFSATILRYFNPVGAHVSGEIGEDPKGIPNNLMPYISQTASGKREKLSIFGNDYPTVDGTGVRDYIHVMDLAQGHVDALSPKTEVERLSVYNLGMGNGVSVLQLVQAFEAENHLNIPYEIAPRRAGDIAEFYADSTLAQAQLGWSAKYNIADMVRDTWRWQSQNPDGYER